MADKEKMNELAYSKNALLKSEKYAGYADVLTAVLDDDALYTNVLVNNEKVEAEASDGNDENLTNDNSSDVDSLLDDELAHARPETEINKS